MKTRSLIFFLLLVPALPVAAQTLRIAVAPAHDLFSERLELIFTAVRAAGYEVEEVMVPNERAMFLVSEGMVALEAFRLADLGEEYPGVVRLEPPVLTLEMAMVTSADRPENCDASQADYADMSLVGFFGIRLYRVRYADSFKHFEEADSAVAMVQMILMGRADVTFFPRSLFDQLPEAIRADLIFCEQVIGTEHFYLHLNNNYLHAREPIERELRRVLPGHHQAHLSAD